jgi:surface antigen Omp85-like protein
MATGERQRWLDSNTAVWCVVALFLAVVPFRSTARAQSAPTPVAADQGQPAGTPAPLPEKPSKLRSPDDGWVDLSGFLDTRYGFLPVAGVITEPAVGLGAAGVLAFIDKPLQGNRPNITMAGGFGTENGTKGAVAGDLRYWLDRRVQTLGAAIFASVNLDFYGIGDDGVLASDPLRYNLEPTAGLVEAKYRLGNTELWIGSGYSYAKVGVRFDAPAGTPGRPDTSRWSTIAGLTPSITFDGRDNLFTPTRGTYVEGKAGFFSEALGGDEDFQRLRVVAMQFVPLPERLFLGVRGEASIVSSDTPFYMRPFIYQRGVPAMRYLGDEMAQIETELRWQFWKRLSLVGFGGGGGTWTDVDGRTHSKGVTAGGVGGRYELARSYGIHIGADFAYGPDGSAFYIQFGSAWARP